MLCCQEFGLGVEEPLKTSAESKDMIKVDFYYKYYDRSI